MIAIFLMIAIIRDGVGRSPSGSLDAQFCCATSIKIALHLTNADVVPTL